MGKKKKAKQSNVGICALCKNESNLEGSHIIPKFTFKYLKEHSFTGRFRSATDPNRPVQDGVKMPLLCPKCEDLFNVDETTFSRKIFHPFKNNGFNEPVTFSGDWLNRFATSVSWRILYRDLNNNYIERILTNPLPSEALDKIYDSEEIMRSYLLKERTDLGDLENHIVFFDEKMMKTLFNRPHAIIQGSIFGTTLIMSKDAMYVISNMVGIFIITIIQKHQKENWSNTFVSNTSGKIAPPQRFLSPIIFELVQLENIRQAYKDGISQKQLEILIDKIRKDPDGFKKSETYKRFILDKKLK